MLTRKKIKVLECIRQGQIGGGESHLLSLVENLDRSSFEPVVLSFTEGPMVTRLKEMDVKTDVIYTERPFDVTKWSEVKKFLAGEKVDLIHAHGTRACSNILWAARSLNIPVIYTVHGWSFHQNQSPLVRRLRIMGEKYLTSRSSRNISVSASNQQSGKDVLKNFESVVVNNGIDQRKFSPERPKKDIKASLNIPETAVLVLFIARFTVQKQPLTLIKSFFDALSAIPDMYLLMVGDGDQKQEAEQLVAKASGKDKIIFQAFRQDVPDLLAVADIFVLPSLWEGLPIGLLEAMAMGKAIIASDVDGTREVIRNNENGLMIEAGNTAALTDALVLMAKDKELREKLGKKAFETINEQYNAVNMTRSIENIYRDCIN